MLTLISSVLNNDSNLDRLEFKVARSIRLTPSLIYSNLDRLEFKDRYCNAYNHLRNDSNLDRLEFKDD